MIKKSFLEIAKKILEEKKVPLSYMEILECAENKGYIQDLEIEKQSNSKMIEELYTEVNNNPNSIFKKIGSKPTRFILKKILSEYLTDLDLKKNTVVKNQDISDKKLHSYLTYFNHNKWNLKSKTLFYGKSTARKYSKWLHPNMVGIKINDKNIQKGNDIKKLIDEHKISIYSFEIAKSLDYDNLRKYYFNSLATSDWAHEGYIAVVNLNMDDDDVMRELHKLNSKFNNGIINIDLFNPDFTNITFPAFHKDTIDWEKLNTLSNQNSDLKNLIQLIENSSYEEFNNSNHFDYVPEIQELY
jgi:uncharacterized protein